MALPRWYPTPLPGLLSTKQPTYPADIMPVGVSTGTIREPFETRACLYLLLRCSVFACKDTVQSIDLTNFFATFFKKFYRITFLY